MTPAERLIHAALLRPAKDEAATAAARNLPGFGCEDTRAENPSPNHATRQDSATTVSYSDLMGIQEVGGPDALHLITLLISLLTSGSPTPDSCWS
jgi:hypothetical protein